MLQLTVRGLIQRGNRIIAIGPRDFVRVFSLEIREISNKLTLVLHGAFEMRPNILSVCLNSHTTFQFYSACLSPLASVFRINGSSSHSYTGSSHIMI